jgi:sulfur carrier protein
VNVVVNGHGREVADGSTVADLVRALGARERGSAVAVEGEIVPRGSWHERRLSDGDAVEIVTAVQGG